MSLTFDNSIRFHQDALNLRASRQQLLASNIANADTPGYKARDIDFGQALSAAASARPSDGVLMRTSARHLGTVERTAGGAPLLYRSAMQPSIDGNTVDLNVERAQFAENAVRYEANLMFISHQVKAMLAAIQG